MTFPAVNVPRFGGLDYLTDPADLGFNGAVDLANVVLDGDRVRTRPGYTSFVTAPTVPRFLLEAPDGRLVVGTNTDWITYNTDGSIRDKASNYDSVNQSFGATIVGTTSSSDVYASSSVGLVKYDGTNWSFINTGYSPIGDMLVTPWGDNRLALVGTYEGLANHRSLIRFSDPGDPENYTANNFLEMAPGDGEDLLGAAVWRNMLFVFKKTKYFVFYGATTDGQGFPVFQYRTVDVGIGAAAQGCVTACEDGVYFTGSRGGPPTGVYRTTGGAPEHLSTPLQPLFDGETPPYAATLSGLSMSTATTIGQWRTLVLCSFGGFTFTYDRVLRAWGMWKVPAKGFGEWFNNNPRSLYMAASDNHVYRIDDSYTTDNGTAITGTYRTGFADLGYPQREKIVREILVSGSGTVNAATAVNDAATLSSTASVVLGTAPAVATGRDRRAVRGRNVSVQLSGTAPFAVSAVELNISGVRAPGLASV